MNKSYLVVGTDCSTDKLGLVRLISDCRVIFGFEGFLARLIALEVNSRIFEFVKVGGNEGLESVLTRERSSNKLVEKGFAEDN